MDRLCVGLALLLACSGCGNWLDYRLLSTEGQTPLLELPARFEYWQFRAGTVNLLMTVRRAEGFSISLWVEPTSYPQPYARPPVSTHANLKANLLEMTLQQPARTYRPQLVERWTRIPKFLFDEWNVESIPTGEISSVGMYDVIRTSFDKEIAALDTFDIVLPTIAVDGTPYNFPPVNFLKVRIRGSFIGCDENAARVLQPGGSKDGHLPCVSFY